MSCETPAHAKSGQNIESKEFDRKILRIKELGVSTDVEEITFFRELYCLRIG
jgi:hypothetical protein